MQRIIEKLQKFDIITKKKDKIISAYPFSALKTSHKVICEREMMVVVKDSKIDSCNPEGIIEFVSNRERGECTAETLCPFINFFCSEKDMEEWREKNPEFRYGEIYSLDEALEHGKTIFESF